MGKRTRKEPSEAGLAVAAEEGKRRREVDLEAGQEIRRRRRRRTGAGREVEAVKSRRRRKRTRIAAVAWIRISRRRRRRRRRGRCLTRMVTNGARVVARKMVRKSRMGMPMATQEEIRMIATLVRSQQRRKLKKQSEWQRLLQLGRRLLRLIWLDI